MARSIISFKGTNIDESVKDDGNRIPFQELDVTQASPSLIWLAPTTRLKTGRFA